MYFIHFPAENIVRLISPTPQMNATQAPGSLLPIMICSIDALSLMSLVRPTDSGAIPAGKATFRNVFKSSSRRGALGDLRSIMARCGYRHCRKDSMKYERRRKESMKYERSRKESMKYELSPTSHTADKRALPHKSSSTCVFMTRCIQIQAASGNSLAGTGFHLRVMRSVQREILFACGFSHTVALSYILSRAPTKRPQSACKRLQSASILHLIGLLGTIVCDRGSWLCLVVRLVLCVGGLAKAPWPHLSRWLSGSQWRPLDSVCPHSFHTDIPSEC